MFESGEGKDWIETALADRLVPDEINEKDCDRYSPSIIDFGEYLSRTSQYASLKI
jgi:hypothetical protein